MHCSTREGNGTPLQYSCLGRGTRLPLPRDGGAWWAAVYGVTQSRTQLKQLSSSSSSSTPGLPVYDQLPKFTQTHVHWVGDAIQPSHPLSSLLLLPSIFPSIRVFSTESTLHIKWPKYWSFSFNISPSSEHSGLLSFRMDWLDLLAVCTLHLKI